MPKLRLAIVCEKVIVDANSNVASYINVLREFTVSELPVTCPPMTVACVWEREGEGPDELRQRLTFRRPDGSTEDVWTADAAPMTKRWHRANVALVGLPLRHEGDHAFLVYYHTGKRWQKLAEISLTVKVKEPENGEEGS